MGSLAIDSYGLSRQVAETLLAELRLVFDRDAEFRRDNKAGFAGARVGARDHQRRLKLQLDSDGGFQSLAPAEVRDLRLARGGEAPNRVALALAVTNHYQFAHRVEIFSENSVWCERIDAALQVLGLSSPMPAAFANARNGSNRSIGSGKTVVELFSVAISLSVCR